MKKFWIYFVQILSLLLFLFVMFRNIPMIWLALYGITLVVALFFGRIFCGWICPINTCMKMTDKIAKKHKLQRRVAPSWLSSGWLSWALLIAFIGFMIVARRLKMGNIPVLLYFVGLGIILTFFFRPEVFHNAICPFGALQNLFGRTALFSRKVHPNKCTGCQACVAVCPSEAISISADNRKASINTSLCHQCLECQTICPVQAIDYGRKSKNTSS